MNYMFFAMMGGTSLLMAALGIPMWRRSIKPNPWYGFRTKTTIENPKIWYEVNAVSGMELAILGAVMALASLPLLFIREKMAIVLFLSIYAAVLIVGLIIITVQGIVLSRKLHDQGWGGEK